LNKLEFIPTIAPIIQNINKEFGSKLFNSVVIAQAILETGFGSSSLMMKANAVFGIKATKSWKGKVYNSNTKECYDGVSFTDVSASFRAYDSLEESVRDYFKLITGSKRYEKALNQISAFECIKAIKDGGYATDPNYVESIMKLIKTNNLTSFDDTTNITVNNVENYVNNQTNSYTTYTVQKGDTLSQIASRFRTTYQKLASYNNIQNPNLIYPGQVILIPETANIPVAQVTYTVKSGDTLSSIGKKYGISWKKLYEKNKDIIGPDYNKIYPGQKLVI
jgi:LysM repeat protein